MQTTGSRRLQLPPGVLRLLVGATAVFAVLAILAGNSGAILGKAEAGVVSKVTVNSRGNTVDGDCEGAPNDNIIGGDCTLAEAILDANNGLADLINFHPPVFPENDPGTIIIDSEDQGGPDGVQNNIGCLPSIQRDGIIIDATGAGVIIDGDDDDDPSAETDGTPEECVAAILAEATNNGFDFTVIGNGHLTIKQFDADGIQVDGGTSGCATVNIDGSHCSLGNIDISGVTIEQIGYDSSDNDGNQECAQTRDFNPPNNVRWCFSQGASDDRDGGGGDGIDIERATTANKIHITSNIIDTEYADFSDGEAAVDIGFDRNEDADDGIFDDDIIIDISGNSLNAEEEAVDIDITGDIGDPFSGNLSTATIMVNDNTKVASDHEEAVNIDWNGCIFKSTVTIEVDGNSNITGNQAGDNGDAVDIEVHGSADDGDCKELDRGTSGGVAGATPIGSEFATVNVSVSDNGSIGAPSGEDGVDIEVDLCCGSEDGHSKHVVTVHVDRNEDIRGDEHGVEVDSELCCSDGNASTVTVNDNDEITGMSDDAVDIHQDVGARNGPSQGNEDADENQAIVEVNGNGRITGAGDDGVNIDNHAGAFYKGSGDDNEALVSVSKNERIAGGGSGGSDGVRINNAAGSGLHNHFSDGGGEADGNHASVVMIENGDISGGDDDGIDVDNYAGSLSFFNNSNQAEGDNNVTDLLIQDNGSVTGFEEEGMDIDVFAGGDTKGSLHNVNNVSVIGNDEIEGFGNGNSNDGAIDIEANVCCSTQKQGNENRITVNDNDKVIGHSGDGLDIDTCCTASINRVTIADNERMVGGDGNAIEYEANPGSCSPGNWDGPCVGLSHDIKQDGFIDTVHELIITGNLLEDSEDNGIYVCCGAFESDDNDVKSLIKDNVIRKNVDHGIEIDSSFGLNVETNEIYNNGDEADTDAGIIIHNESSLCDFGENNLSCNVRAIVPANHNRISQNSIYDNKGLGIDLAADPDLDGLDDEDHGVGCQPKAEPINPNDCLAAPDFKTLAKSANGTKVTGTACALCTVEIFIADQDPADQGKSPLKQSGEGAEYITDGQADEEGNFSIVLDCTLDLPADTLLTATATDKVKNTSEFSQNISMPSGTSDCTPVPPTNTPVPPTNTPGPTNTPVIVVVTATPTTGGGATATPTTSETKMCGDVNDNGSVDAVDAQLVLQFKAGLIDSLPNEPSADVNDSGEVTSVDAALILQVEAGLIPLGTLHCP